MSTVTTHVLDTSLGQPAAGVPVRLEDLIGGEPSPVAQRRSSPDPLAPTYPEV
jgi:5-hydroxyisourate hydrolase